MPTKWPEINPNEVATIWHFIFPREIFWKMFQGFYVVFLILLKVINIILKISNKFLFFL